MLILTVPHKVIDRYPCLFGGGRGVGRGTSSEGPSVTTWGALGMEKPADDPFTSTTQPGFLIAIMSPVSSERPDSVNPISKACAYQPVNLPLLILNKKLC